MISDWIGFNVLLLEISVKLFIYSHARMHGAHRLISPCEDLIFSKDQQHGNFVSLNMTLMRSLLKRFQFVRVILCENILFQNDIKYLAATFHLVNQLTIARIALIWRSALVCVIIFFVMLVSMIAFHVQIAAFYRLSTQSCQISIDSVVRFFNDVVLDEFVDVLLDIFGSDISFCVTHNSINWAKKTYCIIFKNLN